LKYLTEFIPLAGLWQKFSFNTHFFCNFVKRKKYFIKMVIHKFKDAEELSNAVADYVLELIRSKPSATMVLTSGDTPKKAYQLLAQKATKEDFKDVTIIGLDEWVGIPPESEGSCKYIVAENLLMPLGIPASNYTFFDSLSTDLEAECRRIDKLIFEKGGLDFILVGIGLNGHLGLNEPGSSFESYCQVTDLEEMTIVTGQKYFSSNTRLTQGITVGIRHLLESKAAMIMASGEKKAEIIQRTVSEAINESLPSSCIRLHTNGLLYLDEAAAEKLT
jgi:glucosamine-6-phosphate isomerase